MNVTYPKSGQLLVVSVLCLLTACQTAPEKVTQTQAEPEPQPRIEQPKVTPLENILAGKHGQDLRQSISSEASNPARTIQERHLLDLSSLQLAIGHETVSNIQRRIDLLISQYPSIAQRSQLQQYLTVAKLQLDQLPENLSYSADALDIEINAQALSAKNQHLESARARLDLLSHPQLNRWQHQIQQQQLWQSLNLVGNQRLFDELNSEASMLKAWAELVFINRTLPDQGDITRQLAQWKTRHIDHPASTIIVPYIESRHQSLGQMPQRIAVLLPLSGRLQSYGETIREGIISARLNSKSDTVIDIYDTAGEAENAQYAAQQAIISGADIIIGPLHKAAAQAVLSIRAKPGQKLPRLLLLNQLEAAPDSDFDVIQYGMLPEHEAIQAAQTIAQRGIRNTMVIVPKTLWGNRVYEAFAREAQSLDVDILYTARFQRQNADYSGLLKDALLLQNSLQRHRQLGQLLNEDIEFTPRRRQDIDMIFLAANNKEARQLRPQLEFFYASGIPVFALSSIHTGDHDPRRDRELDDILMLDIPWVINEKPAPGSLAKILHDHWPRESQKYSRFHAMGADAYRLTPYLAWMKNNPGEVFQGHTGNIRIHNGIVKRNLSLSRFKQGVITPAI